MERFKGGVKGTREVFVWRFKKPVVEGGIMDHLDQPYSFSVATVIIVFYKAPCSGESTNALVR